MEVSRQDINAVDMIVVALRKSHFFNIEGDEVLALSSHVTRLLNLKARIVKELELQAMPQPVVLSDARPLSDEPEKKAGKNAISK